MLCEWCGGNVARKEVSITRGYSPVKTVHICLKCWMRVTMLNMLPDDWESQEHAAKEKE